jgi:hypothetical protein
MSSRATGGWQLRPAPLFTAHFEEVPSQLGYPLLPPEDLVRLFANAVQEYHFYQKALQLNADEIVRGKLRQLGK